MRKRKIACFLLAAALWMTGASAAMATVSGLQGQKAQNEKELKNIQSKISSLENQRSALSSELSGLNDELTNTLLNIDILESDLADKEVQIQEAQKDYEEAQATEDEQYEYMKKRIQFLYESGNESYLEILLTAESVADLVNKVDYAEEIQEADRRLLDEYKAAKQAVAELKQQLEEEKEELEVIQEQMEEEKANLELVISRKKNEIADFDSQLSSARAKASEYQKKIKEQNAQIRKLQQEQAKLSQSTGKNSGGGSSGGGSSSGSGSSGGGSVSGGGSGSAIASYGLRFVGNPYVYGGNSLTNGTDCSGFVHLVHANFGISTPRSSSGLAGGGKAVSDSNKLPGDVVCYPGHVGIYIGNNQIVHASTERTGIKISNMYYRSILCIRRYW